MISRNQDPALAECPDFTSDEYREARADFMEGSMTVFQAAQLLKKAWLANQKIEAARWNRRVEEEAVEEEVVSTRRAEEAACTLVQEEVDREEARQEDRKKNPSKIDKGLYCAMYYFTAGGLDMAKKVGAYVDESMVLIMDGTGGMTWIPAIVKRDPGSFKEDQDLTCEEFSGAIPRMLLAMQRSNWPADRVKALAGFWGSLLSHPLRVLIDPMVIKTLLLYQVEQRFTRHNAIPIEGKGWRIDKISEMLIQRAANDVYKKQREKTNKPLRAKYLRARSPGAIHEMLSLVAVSRITYPVSHTLFLFPSPPVFNPNPVS
ncbi:hypothetical protein M422DRAFT_264725 [Sphaerobolus stellatus SS14]|uniref:Uncharacterized protein n=1 Tax=Sphaerobolus stellatus (strain SS14) TaxID=990650 RepID=A0A0C9V7D6_SPHS4|nr:hypothetical protein M422DRAFT_264725 [Sphaerobolus stellatus SS14]